ncbi:MAG: shikimate dehydrogenase [Bacteroidales bacterium]|jgi:shikimate dehydrogenase|nr:shikimate dehydrogenase [Bacteroidales bacterium]
MLHFGLIGNPVSHSLSEKYFNDKFTIENIKARFQRFLLADVRGFPKLLETYPTLMGLSVTSPFKSDIIQYCDELDEIAATIKAVNTLKISRHGGKHYIKGYNTDVPGFSTAILRVLGKDRPDALVLGSGGAARAVAYALNKLGMRFIIVSRNAGPGKVTYGEVDARMVASRKLIINASPAGMGSLINEYPDIPFDQISSDHILYDLVYNPPETLFLQKGKKQHARTENGLIMLQAQAEKAWEIWNSEL